jgi:Ni/Co efflux regulator RcnB
MRKIMTSAIVLSLLAGAPALAQNTKQERQAAREEARQHKQQAKPAPARGRQARPAAKAAAQPRARQARPAQRTVQQRAAQQRQQKRTVQQRQQNQVQRQRQNTRQQERARAQARERVQTQRQRAHVQQQRRWDRTQDRSWFESRWNGRARNFNVQAYRRAFNAPRRFRIGAYRGPPGWSYRRYNVGSSFPLNWLIASIFLDNWSTYGLASPPWGYEWVRSGPDAVLVDVRTGQVLQVEYNVFY